MRTRTSILPLLALALTMAAGDAAQAQASADFRWQRRLAAGQLVMIRNINGNVSVTAASGDQVEIIGRNRFSDGRDRVRAEVVETSDGIVVCALRDDMRCDEDGIHGRSHSGRWENDDRMDFEVRLPASLRLSASSVSGDVTVQGAQREVRASSVSGDVRLAGLRVSRVSATSVSGRVEVAVDQLTGEDDLKFTSVSGDVILTLPRGLNADLTMTTVSGDIDSAFPITLDGRMSRRRLEGRIGSGGRRLTVTTVSGDLRLRTSN